MEPNQNVNPVQSEQVQQPAQSPLVNQTTADIPTKSSSSHKTLIIILAVGIMLVLLIAGTFYLFMQKTNQYAASTTQPTTQTTPSLTQTTGSKEEQEISNVDVGDVESDLKDLNKNLQEL